MATIDNIIQRAEEIRDETIIGANTATRVGGVMVDTAEHLKDCEIAIKGLATLKTYTNLDYAIQSNGTFGTEAYRKHVAIPVSEGDVYLIENYNQNADNLRYALGTSDAYSSGGAVPLVSGTSVVTVNRISIATVLIPSGCSFLLVNTIGYYCRIYDSTGDIADGSITTQKIADGAITTLKIANGAVTTQKTDFFVIEHDGINLLDPNTIIPNKYIRSDNGKEANATPGTVRFATDYIPITKKGLYCNNGIVAGAVIGLAYYDADKHYISRNQRDSGQVATYHVGDAYVRFTLGSDTDPQVNKGVVPLPYEPYVAGDREMLDEEYAPPAYILDNSITLNKLSNDASMEKLVGINLPEEIIVTVGATLQLFHRSVIQAVNPYNYSIEVVCTADGAKNYPRYFQCTPTAVGNYQLTYYVRLNNNVEFFSKSTTIKVVSAFVDASSISNGDILVIGASAVNSGNIQAELKRRLSLTTENTQGAGITQIGIIYPKGNGLSGVNFVGRKSATVTMKEKYEQNDVITENNVDVVSVNYEATGGYTWNTYVTGRNAYRFTLDSSPSVGIGAVYTCNGVTMTVVEINGNELTCTYSGGNTLPASGTLTKSSGSGQSTINYTSYVAESYSPFLSNGNVDFADYATAHCGGNIDVVIFHLGVNDVFQGMGATETAIKSLLDAFHADFPNGKVILSSPPLPDPNGGMGSSYGASGNYWNSITRGMYELWTILQSVASDADYSGFVTFVHSGIQFDIENGYQYTQEKVNARYGLTERLGTNGVHPSQVGYFQVADSIYYALATILS